MKRQTKKAFAESRLGRKYQYVDDVFDQMASRWATRAENIKYRTSMHRPAESK